MKKLKSYELRKLYLDFFASKKHAVIASSSLIPENDPTVLFTTAGMHPLVPYLLGEKHPAGNRLCDVQKCVRTGDIDEVGDNSHFTFFEMLGNWSLGDYFKEDAIKWSYEFLTSEKYLSLPVSKLAVSVFAGDSDCPRDEESAKIWQDCGIAKDKIFYLPKENNWWGPAGLTGPCGPDTEIFIDTGKEKCCDNCSPACDCGKYLEIWNNVFMQYNKNKDGKFEPLAKKNVDTGMGLERTVCVLNGKKSAYDIDLFEDAIKTIEKLSSKKYDESQETIKCFRIILDHIRTATFMIGDTKGITPSNVDQGYVLRRLIRRAIRFGRKIDLKQGDLSQIAKTYVEQYKDVYVELKNNEQKIYQELDKEEKKFSATILQGTKEFEKLTTKLENNIIDGTSAFRLYDTFGFPIEVTEEMAKERGIKVDVKGFNLAFAEHQKKSQAGAEQKFKCGLQDNSDSSANLHTATHLLHSALRKLLSQDICQKGSNITPERLRFDFNFERKVLPDELKQIEDFVNNAINQKIAVESLEMTIEEAKQIGAIGLFESKYGERVTVKKIGDVSIEMCGGAHANNTSELGKFKIVKEESSSSGVRRIKAILIKE